MSYNLAFTTSGDYGIASLSGNICVASNRTVRLKVTGSASFSGNAVIRIQTNASLTIYMVGSSFGMSGNAYVDNQTHQAQDFCLYGLPGCTNTSPFLVTASWTPACMHPLQPAR